MKKRLSLLLAGVMLVMSLAACGEKTSSAASTGTESGTTSTAKTGSGNQLVIQMGPNPATLDPGLMQAVDAANTTLQMFSNLLTYDENENLIPEEAVALPEVSEDGLTYTFTLRDGLKWSDGTPHTAADYEYSWKRVANPETASPYAELMAVIAGYDEAMAGNPDALQVKAIDDTTLEVTLKNEASYFPNLVAHGTYSPVQQATIEANGEKWATSADTYISNGPFKMTEFVRGQYILMEKNENYWNADAIQLDSLKFLLMENDAASLTAFQNGTAQFVRSLPSDEINKLKGTDEFHQDAKQSISYTIYNLENENLKDANVRKALDLAMNREYLADTTMQGTAEAAVSMIPHGVPNTVDGTSFFDEAQKLNGGEPLVSVTPNIEEAKALLKEAGFDESNPLKLVYATNKASYNIPIAEALQQQWKQIGVELTIKETEWAALQADRNAGDFEISRGGWSNDYPDATSILDLFYSTNGNNDSNYDNAVYDKLIDDAKATDDIDERASLLHQAEQMLIDETVVSPVVYSTDTYLMDTSVKGVYHSSLGYFYFMYATVE